MSESLTGMNVTPEINLKWSTTEKTYHSWVVGTTETLSPLVMYSDVTKWSFLP